MPRGSLMYLRYSLLHDSCIAAWLVRFGWLCTIIFTAIYIGYSSKHATKQALKKDGGLSACFRCGNGWNYHVLFFVVGYCIFGAEAAILMKHHPLRPRPWYKKQLHIFLQLLVLALAIPGMTSIVLSKKSTKAQHMYSVHAWTGLLQLLLLLSQVIFGMFAFSLGKLSAQGKQAAAKWHRMLGALAFYSGMGVCVNGWADQQMMMRDFGQFTYGSATMLQSAAALSTWIITGAVFWHLHPSSAIEDGYLIRYEDDGLTDGVPQGKVIAELPAAPSSSNDSAA